MAVESTSGAGASRTEVSRDTASTRRAQEQPQEPQKTEKAPPPSQEEGKGARVNLSA